ncbi:substrate-binding domain-containing protein [Cryptosporangium phraense]|uniref:Substrate-binding domain-containing protein n=1 Tax=Cryptosporangium phraense TaxID=2593070 RepID=A0A545AZQ3_9ACTN|nr:substrate-binding domain-containing protein [Cryptosporangium phraense]TQS46813.1 substrate-binding domain-containing protein [Cryptosporangium phraense]
MRVLLVVALLVAVAGCTREPTTTPLAALVVVGAELNSVTQLVRGFATGVDRVGGVRHREFGPQIADTAQQLRQFQTQRTPRPDSYAIFTYSPELFADPLAELADDGTPAAMLQCAPAPGSDVPLLVGNDNRLLGGLLARQVARRVPTGATGTIVIGNPAPGVQSYDARITGLREAFGVLFPGVRVLGPFDTKLDPKINQEAWNVLVAANPDALAFVGVGDMDSVSIVAARAAHHAHWAAGGVGLAAGALQAVVRDDLALVSGETFLQGAVLGRLQARYLRYGESLPTGWVQIPPLAITRMNVAGIVARQRDAATTAAWFRAQADQIADHPARYLKPLADATLS